MKKFFGKLLLFSSLIAVAAGNFALAACDSGTNIGEHDHIYGGWTVETLATCTENGSRVHTCLLCGEREEEDIPALGHNYDGGRETKAASCTQTGERTLTCSRCGRTVTNDIPTVAHNWDEGVIDEATCLKKGSLTLTCKDCPATRTVDLGYGAHDPVETGRVEADCEKAGSISYRCNTCGKTLDDVPIAALGHRWKLGDDDREPTCTQAGYRDRVCERCGISQKQTIGELGHSYPAEYTIDKFPTFDSQGEKSQYCLRCGERGNVTAIPKLDPQVPVEYRFRLLRNNGALLADTSAVITVYDGGTVAAQSTLSSLVNGVFTYSLYPKNTYTVKVENLPAGYSCEEEIAMNPGNPDCDIYLSAAPIREAVPAGNRYTKGSVMYDFTLTPAMTTDGKSYTLSELLKEKKAVVLNFWATWCTPCQTEFPALRQAYLGVRDDIEVLAIDQSTSDSLPGVTQFASRFGLPFPVAFDLQNRVQSMFGVSDIPTTVVIDGEGVVCEIHNGMISTAETFLSLFSPYLRDDYWKNTAAHAE